VTTGQANSGRVIAAAAGIMILVFGSFILGGQRQLQEFGFGLAFSVLVDALVIRSVLVPAVMQLIGPANWSIPAWLDRLLPRLTIDTEPEPAPVPASPVRVP
jgi:RND superfamily putative drug exporter